MAETTWLLDVDGVLNANKPGWSAAPYNGSAYANVDEFRIRWAPALIERIKGIHRTGLVDIVWATTWCPWADQIERLMGLPEFGRAWTNDKRGWYAREAKRNAARDVIIQGKRLVWTDDEAIPRAGTDRELLDTAGALTIAPKPNRGLQPDDLDAIEMFVKDKMLADGTESAA